MTMADTIAVMNHGVIEQMGGPAELYDDPATTFVSNFLGQSNLVRGRVSGRRGDDLLVEAGGSALLAPVARARRHEGDVWVGVRPEKVRLRPAGAEVEAGRNVLRGGRVSDVSFTGVSTQYLVVMPGGQELTVFEQNTGSASGCRPGDPVDLHWLAGHTFLLDAEQDAHAGDEAYAQVGAAAVPAGASG